MKQAFPGIEVEQIESRGGAFEVRVEGKLVFSKLAEKRFPAYQEIPTRIST